MATRRSRIVDRIMRQDQARSEPGEPLREESQELVADQQEIAELSAELVGETPADQLQEAPAESVAAPPEEAPAEEPVEPPAPEETTDHAQAVTSDGVADNTPAAPVEEAPAAAEADPTPAPAEQVEAPQVEVQEPAAEDAEEEEEEEDLGALMEAMDIRAGQIIQGTVAQIDEDGVRVDIGTKAEGLIPQEELGHDFASEFNVGDPIDVFVLKVETDEGYPLLSKSRADYHQLWNELEDNLKTGKVLTVMVKDRVRGGLIVDVGVDGFVPASHTTTDSRRRPGNLDKFVGRTLRVRVIECDRKRNRVVLSHRLVVEEERRRREEETLANIEVGKTMTGIVRRITNFGAFVDLGGIDGLLHISEMAWTRVQHPSDVVQKGDKIRVVVLKWDPKTKRISLGMRQLLADPWKGVARRYRVGTMVKAQITRVVQNGAFAKLESGIEGFIQVGELAEGRVGSPADVVKEGDEVEVRVLQVREKQRRITLSLREAQQAKERREYRKYMKTQNSSSVTLGDVFGEMFNAKAAEAEKKAASSPEASAETQAQAEVETPPGEDAVQKAEAAPAPEPEQAEPLPEEEQASPPEAAAVEGEALEAAAKDADSVVEPAAEEVAQPAPDTEAQPAAEAAVEEPVADEATPDRQEPTQANSSGSAESG